MELMTLEELCAFTKKRPTATRRAVRERQLPQPIKVGGTNRWFRDEVEAALEAMRAARDAQS